MDRHQWKGGLAPTLLSLQSKKKGAVLHSTEAGVWCCGECRMTKTSQHHSSSDILLQIRKAEISRLPWRTAGKKEGREKERGPVRKEMPGKGHWSLAKRNGEGCWRGRDLLKGKKECIIIWIQQLLEICWRARKSLLHCEQRPLTHCSLNFVELWC